MGQSITLVRGSKMLCLHGLSDLQPEMHLVGDALLMGACDIATLLAWETSILQAASSLAPDQIRLRLSRLLHPSMHLREVDLYLFSAASTLASIVATVPVTWCKGR